MVQAINASMASGHTSLKTHQAKVEQVDVTVGHKSTQSAPIKLTKRFYAGIGMLLAASFCAGAALVAQSMVDSIARISLVIFGVIALLFGAAIGRSLVRHISSALGNVDATLKRMAAGDLTDQSGLAACGDLGGLQQTIQDLDQRLFSIVSKSRLGATSIAVTAGVISSDNVALSSRTEAQASALEETSSTMEQLTATVKQNADSAQHANGLMAVVTQQAEAGGKAVDNAVRAMEEIKDSSRWVVDIIGVINGIAFQTNILALNAAIEAARAGAEGRAFAVVASAVRELAQRSADAATEIKVIIGKSADIAERGAVEVGAAGDAIGELMCGIRQMASIMDEIAQASAEQRSGIEEINQAISHIDGVTQKNALLVEEAVKTASGLQEQAVELANAVSVFRLGAREYGNADNTVALVKAGVAFVHEQGTQALIEDVLKLRKSRFVDRDLYFSVNHIDGTCLANGANPRVVGNDGNQTRDSDGKFFVREILALARRGSSGWVDYKYPHPVTKSIQLKSTYFERVEDIIISCGFYPQPA